VSVLRKQLESRVKFFFSDYTCRCSPNGQGWGLLDPGPIVEWRLSLQFYFPALSIFSRVLQIYQNTLVCYLGSGYILKIFYQNCFFYNIRYLDDIFQKKFHFSNICDLSSITVKKFQFPSFFREKVSNLYSGKKFQFLIWKKSSRSIGKKNFDIKWIQFRSFSGK
jgi:hypothetical protein